MSTHLKVYRPLVLCMLIPMLIVTGYFIYRGFAPFGDSTVLTVDLGQQYIDFLAFYKHTLLHDWSGFLYSFSMGFGSGMVGTWSYYLMSPLNLLVLFGSDQSLPSIIGVMTILKYGLAGTSFGYLLIKVTPEQELKPSLTVVAATAYVLMGWMVANQLNIIWTDALYLLPLVFYGLWQVLQGKRAVLYTVCLAIAIIVNYYMAWMMVLFIVLYVIMFLPKTGIVNGKSVKERALTWIKASAFAGVLTSWLTIPTVVSLLESKARYSAHSLPFSVENNVISIFGKFFVGAFNFKQLPSGTANIFVGSLLLLMFCYYWWDSRVSKSARYRAAGVTVVLFLSLFLNPLDIIWHGMQMPVWYPYRFSYIVSFWMIYIGYSSLTSIFVNGIQRKVLARSIATVVVLYLVVIVQLSFLKYLKPLNVGLTLVFAAITIWLVSRVSAQTTVAVRKRILSVLLMVLMIEMGANLALSLNHLSYVKKANFTDFTTALSKVTEPLKETDASFFRTGTTFAQTKNDAFLSNYHGGSSFSSTLEAQTAQFFVALGQPTTNSYVVYSNGTLFTDALLSMKYYLSGTDISELSHRAQKKRLALLMPLTNKPDIKGYELTKKTPLIDVYRNPNAFPLAFATAGTDLQRTNHLPRNNAVAYQNGLAQVLTGTKDLITTVKPQSIMVNNVNQISKIPGATLKRIDKRQQGVATVNLPFERNTSYYMTVGNSINYKNLSVAVNYQPLLQLTPSTSDIIVNIANTDNQYANLSVQLYVGKKGVTLDKVNFYRIKHNTINKMATSANQQPMKVTKQRHNSVDGEITVRGNHEQVITTIPHSAGWRAAVDGKRVAIHKWANMFMYLNVNKGQHRLHFYYWPKGLTVGIILSLLGIILYVGTRMLQRYLRHLN